MASKYVYAWRDFDGDRQEVSFDVDVAATAADWSGLAAALELWNVGAGAGGGFYDEQSPDSGVAATSPLAQNSLQAIIAMKDTVNGRIYKKRLPFPDLAKAADIGTNSAFIVSDDGLTVFNPLHTDYATLKAEIEANVKSQLGNAVELVRVYIEE